MGKAFSTLVLTAVFLGAVAGIHYGILKLWDARGFLKIRDIAVTGNAFAKAEDIIRASGIGTGAGMLEADLVGASRAVTRLPIVQECEVIRLFPDRIQVRVTERKPAAVLSDGRAQSARLLDSGGYSMGFLTGQEHGSGAGLPVIVTDYAYSFSETGRVRDDFVAALAANLAGFPRKSELRRFSVRAKDGVFVTVQGAEQTVFALGKTLPDESVFNRVLGIADQIKKNGLKIRYIDVHKQNAIGYK